MGHSYEGLVAYEIAQQLWEQNQEVSFLGLIDSPTPIIENKTDENDKLISKRIQKWKLLLGLSWKDKISFIKERIEYRLSESFQPLMPILDKFMNAYKVKAYRGKITVFSAIFEFYALEDVNFGWDKWTNEGVEIYEIPGTHRSILLKPENAKILARQISHCLDK